METANIKSTVLSVLRQAVVLEEQKIKDFNEKNLHQYMSSNWYNYSSRRRELINLYCREHTETSQANIDDYKALIEKINRMPDDHTAFTRIFQNMLDEIQRA